MKEIEVKILNINRKEIEKKLISLGAKKIFDGKIEAEFFDFENNSLQKSDIILRLRKEEEKIFLTFKKLIEKKDIKIEEELEVEVSDFEISKEILKSLGFKIWKTAQKHRTSYSLENVHFEFDNYLGDYEFIPEFLEIEAKSIEEIYKFVKILGFEKSDCKP